MFMLFLITSMTIAYLLGSLNSAILVCQLINLPDPRTQGSGNPGATNVARVAGKKAALVVLVADVLKGFVPVFMVHILLERPFITSMTALAAFLGHLYPVFFKFKGGKGVATALGGLLGISFVLGSVFAAIWLIVAGATRLSSLSALIAMTATTFLALFLNGIISTLPIFFMLVMLFWRHKANIERLLSGTEAKI